MEGQHESFRQCKPGLVEKLLYQKIMKQANWEYPIGDLLAHGGMASVYELKTPEGVRRQVVKVIDTRMIKPEFRYIINNHGFDECEIMSQLAKRSPNIMPLYGSVWTEIQPPFWQRGEKNELDRIYLLQMPRMRNLLDVVGAGLSERDIIQIGLDISNALQACYSVNRIHRDVKPDNIFVCKRKDRLSYILGDFGIARIVDDRMLTGVGTEKYLAPEMLVGWISRNSDIYSLGVTLYVLAGGQFGSGDTSGELAWGNKLDWQQFKQHNRISPQLLEILRKALQDRHARYREPIEMYEDLWKLQNSRNYL